MIHLNGISKSFGPQILFDDLDWHLKRSQRVGLVGPNGAGKTTLIRLITGEELPDGGTVRLAKGLTLGYLPQEMGTLSGISVREEARRGLVRVLAVAELLREAEAALEGASAAEMPALVASYGTLQAEFEALGGFQIENQVEVVLAGLGFKPDDYDRDCSELSGGWQMRVVLARLLLQRPDVMLLDEPTNHLDLVSVVWLERFLQGFGGSLVFISHDRQFLNGLSTHIAELSSAGLRVYKGNFEAYLLRQEEDRELAARQAKNQQRRVAELERFIDRFRAKATKARQVQSRVKLLDKLDRVETVQRVRSIQFKLPPPPKSGRVVMELENVRKAYGPLVVYDGLNLELVRGRHLALVGPNGAGKSTLLKLMAGAIRPDEGVVGLGFQAKPYHFAQHQVESLDLKATVLQEVSSAAEGLPTSQLRAMLGAFLFGSDDLEKPIGVLSGGEKSRIALVKMLLTPANVLLLDEPTNHLDMASRAMLELGLSAYEGTLVLISHDRHFIDAVCDEVWEVDSGRVTPFLGNYSEYSARVARGDRPAALPLRRGAKPTQWGANEAASGAPAKSQGGYKSREDKRVEAQERKQRAAATGPLKKRVQVAEAEAADLEVRLEALQGEQAEQAHYDDPVRVRAVAIEVAEIEAGLESAYARWEDASSALEVLEADL